MVHFRGKNLHAKCIFDRLCKEGRITKEQHELACHICNTKPTWEYEGWMRHWLLHCERREMRDRGQTEDEPLTYWPLRFEPRENFYVTPVSGYIYKI